MSGWTRGSLFAALKATGVASILGWVLVLSAGPALADPDPAPGDPGVVAPPAGPPAPPPLAAPPPLPVPAPPAPDPLAAPVVAGPAGGQDPTPFTGTAPFGPPRFVPANGSTVGVAQPIIINFPGLVDDAGAAESAVTHLFGPAGSRQVLLDDAHAAALAPAELLARAHRGDRRCGWHSVQLPNGRQPGGYG